MWVRINISASQKFLFVVQISEIPPRKQYYSVFTIFLHYYILTYNYNGLYVAFPTIIVLTLQVRNQYEDCFSCKIFFIPIIHSKTGGRTIACVQKPTGHTNWTQCEIDLC